MEQNFEYKGALSVGLFDLCANDYNDEDNCENLLLDDVNLDMIMYEMDKRKF